MKNSFLMVLYKFLLKYIFVKLQDLKKETEFIFLLGLPIDMQKKLFDGNRIRQRS